jgi:hypothetical protein
MTVMRPFHTGHDCVTPGHYCATGQPSATHLGAVGAHDALVKVAVVKTSDVLPNAQIALADCGHLPTLASPSRQTTMFYMKTIGDP